MTTEMEKKINKPSELPNPVLHFGSDVFKCENQVRRLFRRGGDKIRSGQEDIKEGLVTCLKNKVPTHKVLSWLFAEDVRSPKQWAATYDRLAQKNDQLVSDLVAKKISWSSATQQVSAPRPVKTRKQIGKHYVHQLAVWTYRTGTDLEEVIALLRDEFDRISVEKPL